MKRSVLFVAIVLAGVFGCAHSSNVGSGTNSSGQYFGTFGITGSNAAHVVERGSRLQEISIIGDKNVVTVEDGTLVSKIEFWGSDNEVSLPFYMTDVRLTQIGRRNKVVRRARPPMSDPASSSSTRSTTITIDRVSPTGETTNVYTGGGGGTIVVPSNVVTTNPNPSAPPPQQPVEPPPANPQPAEPEAAEPEPAPAPTESGTMMDQPN